MNTSTTAQCGSEIVGEIKWRFYREGVITPITEDEARHTFDRWRVLSDDRGGALLLIDQMWGEIDALRSELAAARKALEEIAKHPQAETRPDGSSYAVGWAFWSVQCIARAALSSKEPEGER